MKVAATFSAALVAATAAAWPGIRIEPTRPPKDAGVAEGVPRLRSAELPAATRVQNTTDPEVCGLEHTLEDLVVSVGNRALRHMVVAIAGVPREAASRRQPARLVMDNRGCRFDPHVAVAMLESGRTTRVELEYAWSRRENR